MYNLTYEDGIYFAPDDSCEMYLINWSESCPEAITLQDLETCFDDNKLNQNELIPCEDGFESVFDDSVFTSTVVTEWQLVCGNSWIDAAISTIFMTGLLFGVSIFGPIMDKYGRKRAIQIAAIGLVLVQIPLIFIPEAATVWTYAALRFLSAVFVIACGTAAFVYATEIVGLKWRTWFGVETQGMFSVGYMFLSLIGYIFPDWQNQMIVIAIAPCVYIFIFYWLLPTSAAWLFSVGKTAEGREVVQQWSKKYPTANIDETFIDQLEHSVQQKMANAPSGTYSQLDLFKPPRMRIVTIVEMYQWFATTLVYYGLSFGAGNLGGSVLMNNFFNGLVEFVAYIFLPGFIDLKVIGRKYGTVVTMGIGATGCILTGVFDSLSEGDEESTYFMLKKIFAFVGKFGVAGTFGIVYVHASELYPTPIRGIGVGISSAGGRIGGILAPLVNSLYSTYSWLPYIIFGTVGIIQVVTVFLLPETLGVPMLTTIEEAEEFYRKGKIDKSTEVEKDNVEDEGTSSL